MFKKFYNSIRTSPAGVFLAALVLVVLAYLLPWEADRATGGLLLYAASFIVILSLGLVGVKISRAVRAYFDKRKASGSDNDGDGYPDKGLTLPDAVALAGLYRFAGLVAIACALFISGSGQI